jgi:hypothetical protein
MSRVFCDVGAEIFVMWGLRVLVGAEFFVMWGLSFSETVDRVFS